MTTRTKCYCLRLELLVFVIAVVFFITYGLVDRVSDAAMTSEEVDTYNTEQRICTNKTRNVIGGKWTRIIHQIWAEGSVPQYYQTLAERCKQMNPDHIYKLWTSQSMRQLLVERYPWFLKTYDSYPYPIQRIDAARVFILLHHGGVYLDIDMACKVPMSQIYSNTPKQNYSVILAKTDPVGVTNNMLIAKRGSRFLDYLSHRLAPASGHYVTPYFTVLFTAGPLFVYRSYLKYPCKDHIYLMSTFDHSSLYFDHFHASKWHDWDAPFFLWFDHHGRVILQVLAVLGIVLLLRLAWTYYRHATYRKDTKVNPLVSA